MKLEGKNTNWILVNVCIKNAKVKKESFQRAAKVLGLDPQYYHFFSKNILKKIKLDESSDPKLL